MDEDKEPMQAAGTGGFGAKIAEEKNPPSADRPDMMRNTGQSGGGPYPSPHNDPENANPEDTFMGHGGQSDLGGMGGGDEGPDGLEE